MQCCKHEGGEFKNAQEGEHTNNYVEVEGSSKDPAAMAARERILADDCVITDEERAQIEAHFAVGK